jgi:hypothetical protein
MSLPREVNQLPGLSAVAEWPGKSKENDSLRNELRLTGKPVSLINF